MARYDAAGVVPKAALKIKPDAHGCKDTHPFTW